MNNTAELQALGEACDWVAMELPQTASVRLRYDSTYAARAVIGLIAPT